MAHLRELRSRLLRIVLGVLVIFIPLSFFAKQLYAILAQPMLRLLPAGSSMIATEVASPFFAPIKLAAVVAFIAATRIGDAVLSTGLLGRLIEEHQIGRAHV